MNQDNGTQQKQPPEPPQEHRWFGKVAHALAEWAQRHSRIVRTGQILALVAIAVLSFLILGSETFRNFFSGYIGALVINLLSSATILLPAPGLLVTCTFAAPGVMLNIWLLALTAAVGSTIGEMIAYLVGYTGSSMLKESKPNNRVERLRPAFDKYGGPLLMLLAFLPIPLFDLAGVLAGAVRMNVLKFLGWVFVGKVFKFAALVWVCNETIDWLERLLLGGVFDDAFEWLRMLVGL